MKKGDVLELGAGKKSNYTLGTDLPKDASVSLLLPKDVKAENGTILRRVRSECLIQTIRKTFLSARPQRETEGILSLLPGTPACLTVISGGQSVSIYSELNVQNAENRPLEAEQLKKRLSKTGESDFFFSSLRRCISACAGAESYAKNGSGKTAAENRVVLLPYGKSG